ncbi:MAG: hypothetical protein A2Y10_10655 [Planctomycetes bacterium GWF2_41_51]|nr:MAG: hypothetical protein A2Y10_10655 [Planctomycetes bacterium GWF2_41_51]
MDNKLFAGAAQVDISPKDSQFLFGYPHIERYSTGINDPLLSSALYLSDERTAAIMVANDIVFVGKKSAQRIRERITAQTGILAGHIMISATHTHSGPITVDYISNEADPIVPKTDQKYVAFMEDRIVEAAIAAYKNAQPARVGLACADSTGIGTNRRDPKGPADMQVPVLLVQNAAGTNSIACMLVCSMHPTVLHEDSKLVSGDFPAYSRMYLQKHCVDAKCAVLHHTGPAGNQSPRHVTKANTFAEAQRLGEILGKAVEKVLPTIQFTTSATIQCKQALLDLPKRTFPDVPTAQKKLDKAIAQLEYLRTSGAPRQEVRTAECDWFGAEETLTMAKAAAEGRLSQAYELALPAEIQIVKIGPWAFVGWQGECFVDYALALKKLFANTFVISCANGELQGYIVTEEASNEGGYEASNALLSYKSGDIMVHNSTQLLRTM